MAVSKVDAANQIENQLPQANIANNVNFRNYLINGDMSLSQRGDQTGKSGASVSFFAVDRFKTTINNAGTWDITQETDAPSNTGLVNSIKLDCTSADSSLGSGDYVLFTQALEGQMLQNLMKGTSNAKELVLSFWVKSSTTGNFTCEIDDVDNTRHFVKLISVDAADTWEKKTVLIDADTTGALGNDNGNSLSIVFWLAAGTNFTSGTLPTGWAARVSANRAVGISNLAGDTDSIQFTGMQLEINDGSDQASDFEFLPHDVNLQRCQRYFAMSGSTFPTAGGNYNQDPFYLSTSNFYSTSTQCYNPAIRLPVTMRAVPTTTFYPSGLDTANQTTGHVSVYGSADAWKNSNANANGKTRDIVTLTVSDSTGANSTKGFAGMIFAAWTANAEL